MVRFIKFYCKESGESPVKDFLDSLPGKAAQKLTWVLSIVEELAESRRKDFLLRGDSK